MMDRNQTALQAALESAHRERDARSAKAYVARRAAKNRKPAVDLFTKQLGLPPDWRDGFLLQERADELRHRQQRAEKQRRLHMEMLGEMRMARWRDARGQGLRDW